MRLLIALPALNEQATIGQVLDDIPKRIAGVGEIRILVVDDGSDDRTSELARERGAHVIRHTRTGGVGRAFHTALRHGIQEGFDLIATLDADGQFDPRYLTAVIAPVVSDEFDFATASRFMDPTLTPRMPWAKRWGNRLMSSIVSRLAGQRIYDVSCGMRCYGRAAALELCLLGRFTYVQEVILNLSVKQLRIAEVPVRVAVRRHGRSRVADNLLRYGWRAGRILLRCYRDFFPLRFFAAIAVALLAPAASLAGFLAVHYLRSGQLSPHKWAGFLSLALSLLAGMALHLGLVGDLMVRLRVYLEELLYLTRRATGPTWLPVDRLARDDGHVQCSPEDAPPPSRPRPASPMPSELRDRPSRRAGALGRVEDAP
jgi:glycosyltransferase involved in cell wall biosynthesis